METSNFNKDYANRVSKVQWFKDHAQHGSTEELEAIYSELVDRPKPVKAEK